MTICDVCHRAITVDACARRPNDPGDHDPAFHVAKAYHVEQPDGRCWSCGEPWPCTTLEAYR
jgi:hypothetical protein